ncbi:exodeoxyribonuclease III [Actinobaculum sp. 313]|uniref:exodeoxyribonuclease III n=1 Tax=Actinobaculum sp. 313 TaxID=2495645 RepID=UPI000D525951|nr:exodeoxyribonuclease III [Actinobaculum sp. 313]AWE42130.1 exodeoxyribonuclease III [Actinobaculum sp. 313]
MKIATCNVNGIRAAVRKGLAAWIAAADPDVLLLQEVRAPDDLVAPLIGEGYQVITWACDIRGRAGVAIAVREGIEIGREVRGLSAEQPPVDTGRWLEVELPEFGLRVVSAYLHSGDAASPEKMAAKYAHLDAVDKRLTELLGDGSVLVGGDFNIVRGEQDIANWKPNHNRHSGVLDPEIAYLNRWFGEYGYVDVQRFLLPDGQGPYTWWSQRGKAFDNNTGWRIDYQLVSPALAGVVAHARVDRALSYQERFSDHAPFVVDYALEATRPA